MKKRFTLILASMLLTMGAWAQTLADGIYTIQADENGKRGYLAASSDYERPVLTEISWADHSGNSCTTNIVENSKMWYIKTINGVSYLYNIGNGKFIIDNHTDNIYFNDKPYGLNITAHNNYTHIGSGTGVRYLSMGCGTTAPDQVKWEKNNGNDGGCLLTLTKVTEGDYTTQIADADNKINKLFYPDFTHRYYKSDNNRFWNAGELSEYPEALNGDDILGSTHSNHKVYGAVTHVEVPIAQNVTVTFTHDGGNHQMKILGVDIVDANGNIVADYHLGSAGGNHVNNVYTLSDVPAGSHTLRYFVCDEVSGSEHVLNQAQGYITVTGARKVVKAGFNRLIASNRKYLSNQKSGTLQTKNDLDATTIFYLEAGQDADTYYLVNFAQGHYVTNPWNIGVGDAIVTGSEKYKNLFTITEGKATNKHLLGYKASDGTTNYITGGDGTNANTDGTRDDTQWYVQPVTSLPVTIGPTGYATLYAPVALEIPAGVTAHVGTINGEWLTLTPIEDVIPANTGVVLTGDAATYNFAITTTTNEVESALTGNAFARLTTGNPYTLQSHEGGVAFKKFTGESLTGFKAYLTVESQTQAIRIRKAGDEETTSIEPSTLNPQPSTVIYDLQGRRVQQMEKGIYIVNGRKVIR